MKKLLHERLREVEGDNNNNRFYFDDGFYIWIPEEEAEHIADEIERDYIPRQRSEDGLDKKNNDTNHGIVDLRALGNEIRKLRKGKGYNNTHSLSEAIFLTTGYAISNVSLDRYESGARAYPLLVLVYISMTLFGEPFAEQISIAIVKSVILNQKTMEESKRIADLLSIPDYLFDQVVKARAGGGPYEK